MTSDLVRLSHAVTDITRLSYTVTITSHIYTDDTFTIASSMIHSEHAHIDTIDDMSDALTFI